MAWKIASWARERGEGTVVAPHLGPYPFGPKENDRGVADYEVGEEVAVDLHGRPDAYTVARVWPIYQRQPAGTTDPVFAWANAHHFGDLRIHSVEGDTWRFWLGDCCARCGDTAELAFLGVTWTSFPSEDDVDMIDLPLFRRASAEECAAYALEIGAEQTLYCIVTNCGSSHEGSRHFIAAKDAVVTTPFVYSEEEMAGWERDEH